VVGNRTMTPTYVAQRLVEAVEANQELVMLPKFLIPAVPYMALWQAMGFLNFPNVFDSEHTMAAWKGGGYADERFNLMAKAKL